MRILAVDVGTGTQDVLLFDTDNTVIPGTQTLSVSVNGEIELSEN